MLKLDDRIAEQLRILENKTLPFEEPTFRCHWCLDVGYVEAERIKRFGHEYTTAKPCQNCDTGRAIGNPNSDACERERLRLKTIKEGKVMATADVERQIDSDDDIPF